MGFLLLALIVFFIFTVNSINMKKTQAKTAAHIYRSALRKRFELFYALRQLPSFPGDAPETEAFAELAGQDFLESSAEATRRWEKIMPIIPGDCPLNEEISGNEAFIGNARISYEEAVANYNAMISIHPWKFFAVILRMKPL